MKLSRFVVALALLGYAVALAGSLLSVTSLDRPAVGATAVALLFGGVAALVGTGKVAYMLVQYATTDPSTASDVASLTAGNHWIQVAGRAIRTDGTVEPPLSSGPIVAQSVEVRKQETLSGLPWPRAFTHLVDVTEARPFAVTDDLARFRFAADERIRVLDSWRDDPGATVGPNGDRLSESLTDFLARHDRDADAHLSDGVFFDHDLRVAEATVADGETVRLFGRVSVREDGGVVEPTGDGLTAVVATTGSWRTIPTRYLRDALWGVLGVVVLLGSGTGLLALLTS